MKIGKFRTNTSYQSDTVNIDRDHGLIRNMVAMQVGEARGQGLWADRRTLEMMAELSAQKRNIKGRFGHPGMSENETGKQISTSQNFRVEGDKLVHDWYVHEPGRKSPVFSQDPIEYIFSVAEDDPTQLGESVVIHQDLVWTLDDGTELSLYDDDGAKRSKPENSLTPLPVIRPIKFHFVDIVSEGALTPDGMFSSVEATDELFSGSSAYIHEIFTLVDKWRDEYGISIDQMG